MNTKVLTLITFKNIKLIIQTTLIIKENLKLPDIYKIRH
jgi:hypothetical protein